MPIFIVWLAGVTVIEARLALKTVRVVLPDTLPKTAETTVWPGPTEVANPLELVPLLMVATVVAEDLQVTKLVRSWVELSENVPIAANWKVVFRPIWGLGGVTAMDIRAAFVTVRLVLLEIPLLAAVIVVVPAVTGVAKPLEPAALLMDAMDGFEELQVTKLVRS